jgi:hypothetical protein
MSDGRFNARTDGAVVARVLLDIFGGGAGSILVSGVDADDDPVTVNPIVVGGVYFADPSADPIDDGDVGYMLLTDERRVDAEVQGKDLDDAAVTAKPLVAGGVYYSDPTANPIDDGDAGYMLLTPERRPWVEDRVYDGSTDANKNVPVWSDVDLFSPETITGTASGNGTTSYYVILSSFSRWSIQFIPVVAAAETITLRVFQSNHDVDDPTTATFQDVTNTFFGVLGFTASQWIEVANATRAKFLRIDVIVSGYTAGTPAWTIHLGKGGNS